jgi:hypothetical protein
MSNEQTSTGSNSPLVEYALAGLDRCWMPEFGRWSHIYHLEGRLPPNESVAPSDVFYTLNVLLGMARVQRIPDHVDVSGIFLHNVRQLPRLAVPNYALGMALWAAAELKFEIPDSVMDHIKQIVLDTERWKTFSAQDLGMILLGIVRQTTQEKKAWATTAAALFRFLTDHYHSPSNLFFDRASGLRRRFASFATQTYLTLACYAYGEMSGNDRAIEIGNACTRELISLQGPNGEWPWFFDAVSGRVLDYYEVYSVHQYGMAPAFLERAELNGVSEARDAVVRGFQWVLGRNQLRKPMFVPDLHLSIRSQVRKGELRTKSWRVLRAVRNSMLGVEAALVNSSAIELRRECRSYELGWILWSFGARSDLPELTHHELFGRACAGNST